MEYNNINTHATKANSYHIGRPEYPEEFFTYLYDKLGFSSNTVIADIGAGTGKITKRFLEKGCKVFAVEPDPDMIRILKSYLEQFQNCIPIEKPAESTDILSNSIDLIFCGNSYSWFDRIKIIPEFKRIIKNTNNHANIIITYLGPCENAYTNEYLAIDRKFAKPVQSKISSQSLPFEDGMFERKIFEFVVKDEYLEFLHGSLSASHTPKQSDIEFNEYCEALKVLFDKYSIEGKIETKFQLFCMTGKIDDLVF